MNKLLDTHRPLANQLGFWVHRLAVAVRRDHAEHLEDLDLGLSEAWALLLLRSGGFNHPMRLAEALGQDPARTTRMARSLEQRGLLRRTPSAEDRRSVRLELTSEGRKRAERAKRRMAAVEAGLTADLSKPEAHALVSRLVSLLESTGWDPEDV